MPMVLTIEGLDDLQNRGPGKQSSRNRGLREVVEVQGSRRDPKVCVAARYGPPGAAGGLRMVDLCRRQGFKAMRVGATEVDLDGSGEGNMADYSETEFPPIEDLDDLDAMIPQGYLVDHLVGIGANLAARIVGDGTKAIPWVGERGWARALAKGVIGIGGGRALWALNRDAGLVATSSLVGGALYDDLLRPMVLARLAPTVFGGLAVEEERLLGQLTEEERALLDGDTSYDGDVDGLDGSVEEESLLSDASVDDESGRAEEINVGGLGSWIQ